MAFIKNGKSAVTLENDYVRIELSTKTADVLSITETVNGESIMGESVPFFHLTDEEGNIFKNLSLDYEDGVFTLDTEKGSVKISAEAFERHFIFEVQTSVPEGAHSLYIANAEYEYDTSAEDTFRAGAVAMTVNVDPKHFPDGFAKKTTGRVREHLGGGKGARLGLVIVPNTCLREALQELCLKIDSQKGILLRHSGPWSWENQAAQGEYIIVYESSREYLERMLPVYKARGVDQLDFHQGIYNHRQGDFKPMRYESHEEFKEKVSDFLKENGIGTALHTYAFYVQPTCHEMLSDPKRQADLEYCETFTLSENIDETADFITVNESLAELPHEYGFFRRELPYIMIGEEIIRFDYNSKGFKNCVRGACGTKAVAHKKGETVKRMTGLFDRFCPRLGSDLFIEVAKNTAEAYNRGGFDMIYIDAIDGTNRHCAKGETAYYIALFVHEILKRCEREPMMELSDMPASVWASRARMGAWDTPFRNYKEFNRRHHVRNQDFVRRFYNCTLGWYNYYPMTDEYPGNQHTKYHHWDSIDHMGSLAVMYRYSTVPNTPDMKRFAGSRRNMELYNMYSRLRKSHYFSEETLERARACDCEMAIREKTKGKFVFYEKNYQIKRLYDIGDSARNTAEYTNPFKRQTPFVRIEAGLSTLGDEPLVILPLDENAPLTSQLKVHDFGGEIDMREKLAMKVRVKGNGKKGVIGIRLRAGSVSSKGYGLYTIDTDFEGWRDFVLLEADNGDRPDLVFEKDSHDYPVFRVGLKCERMSSCGVEVDGDVEGVQMSSVTACRQVYNVVKNPTVTVGDETLMVECELKSSDFIEWDGKTAKVIDRYGNEKTVYFTGGITAPKGRFKASAGYGVSLNGCPVNIHLTFGFTGKEIK